MSGNPGSAEFGIWLATRPPNATQRRLTLALMAVLACAFIAAAFYANVSLPRSNGFIPYIQAAMSISDFITALLLFTQFASLRWSGLWILANGYLFAGLITFSHTLAFPGAFSSGGLLGAGLQTTGWLHIIWHMVFPAAVLVYASAKDDAENRLQSQASATSTIFFSILLTTATVVAIHWTLITFDANVPKLIIDNTTFAPLATYAGWFDAFICASALAMLWRRQTSLLDRYLMVATFATFVEMLMLTFIARRYTVGWYSVRMFGFVSSSVVLMALLLELTRLYARHAVTTQTLEHERDNKLLNAQAVTASIAHEVRQPLTGIATSAGAAKRFLQATPPDLGRAQTALERAITSSHRVSEIFDNFRALFGGRDQRRQLIDLNHIITDVVQSLQDDIRSDLVMIRFELMKNLPRIGGHPGQLHEVIANLVRNSLEAMRTAPRGLRILTLGSELLGSGEIAVWVKDTGPGITPERLHEIFTAFATTKADGTGLGLAICHMIIEHHGGQLTASSDGIGGALFRFVLPSNPGTLAAAH